MHTTKELKQNLRREMRFKNRNIGTTESNRQAATLWNKLINDIQFKSAKTILFYWSMSDELPTINVIESLYKAQKTILLPVIKNDILTLKEFRGIENMQPEPVYGILEPLGKCFTAMNKIDVVVVPGLAFDTACNRMGRGKGYYDKLLSSIPQSLKIGVGYNHQLIDSIPIEKHDIPLSSIWTAEKTIINNL